jgi:hypothetical protein
MINTKVKEDQQGLDGHNADPESKQEEVQANGLHEMD